MAQYNYFWDLENSQAYTTHTVNQLDANTTTGSGTFKWIPVVNNSSIENIPGIRIKPIANIKGYWERVIDGPWLVDWFGCVNTASQLTLGGYGFTTGDLSAKFNSVTKNVNGTLITPSNVVTLTDTYDTAAMKVAFNLMELGYTSTVQFLNNKNYYISNTCYLPLAYTQNSSFTLVGNNSRIIVHSSKNTTAFTFWETPITTQVQATNSNLNSKCNIENFIFTGFKTAPTTYYHKGIDLKATTGSKLENLSFTYFIESLTLRFCIESQITNVQCFESVNGITVTTGNWIGATTNNSQSSACTLNKCLYSFQDAAYAAELKGFIFEAVDGALVSSSEIDIFNFNFSHKGITLDTLTESNILNFKVDSLYVSLNYFTTQSIGINLIPLNTNIQLNNISDYSRCTLIKCDGTYGGTNNITVRNINTIHPNSQFENSGTNNQWLFENCRIVEPLNLIRWYLSSQPVTGTWTADGPGAGSTIRLRESYPFYNRS